MIRGLEKKGLIELPFDVDLSVTLQLSKQGQLRVVASKTINSLLLINMCTAVIQTNVQLLLNQQTMIVDPNKPEPPTEKPENAGA